MTQTRLFLVPHSFKKHWSRSKLLNQFWLLFAEGWIKEKAFLPVAGKAMLGTKKIIFSLPPSIPVSLLPCLPPSLPPSLPPCLLPLSLTPSSLPASLLPPCLPLPPVCTYTGTCVLWHMFRVQMTVLVVSLHLSPCPLQGEYLVLHAPASWPGRSQEFFCLYWDYIGVLCPVLGGCWGSELRFPSSCSKH